ncbi:MAG: flagellar FliJ family protein [Oscillospiraceae bacterium]|nr:flagellar FliJ family protein [Oscillospiraceae bacterium]
MKKFKFTLQALLNVKLAMEKKHMGELSECNARLWEFERVQQENFRRQRDHEEHYALLLREGRLPVAEMALWRGAFLALRDQIVEQKGIIEQAQAEKARIQKVLLGVMRERKTLESLMEKQLAEHKALQKIEDAVAMDEFLSHQIYKNTAQG